MKIHKYDDSPRLREKYTANSNDLNKLARPLFLSYTQKHYW